MTDRITTLGEYLQQYQESIENPEAFWAGIADQYIWHKKWDQVLEWRFKGSGAPDVKWFVNGKLNITENIFERNLPARRDQVAIIWEPNNPDQKELRITYGELFEKVKQFSNALKKMGINKGDRVAIYLPMVPELVVAMLACARIGAIHSIVFAGFSATSLADRINDAKAKILITSDGGFRGPKSINLKNIADEALAKC